MLCVFSQHLIEAGGVNNRQCTWEQSCPPHHRLTNVHLQHKHSVQVHKDIFPSTVGSLASYKKNCQTNASCQNISPVATKAQFTAKIWHGCPALIIFQWGFTSALVSQSLGTNVTWCSLDWHLQDQQQQSEAPDSITSNAKYSDFLERMQKKTLRIPIYTTILNQWLRQVMSTPLNTEILIFHFYSLNIYNTSGPPG